MTSRLQDVILRDDRANQPAANTVAVGTIYYVTDEGVTERSNGSAWQDISDSGTGIPETLIDAKGDLIAGSAADTAARVAVGTNSSYVRANSGASAGIEWQLNNFSASAAPTANEDSGDGYSVGSIWLDTTADAGYVCLDASVGAAVWVEYGGGGGSGDVVGPGSATDNAVARFDLTTGKLIQDSAFIVDNDGDVTAFGGQITFPATQNPSANANTLDDYEEGTWTPVDSSGASLSFGSTSGNYRKIGGVAVMVGTFAFPATGSGATATIGGFPFAPSAGASNNYGVIVYSTESTASSFAMDAAAATGKFYTSVGAALTNSTCSSDTFQVEAGAFTA